MYDLKRTVVELLTCCLRKCLTVAYCCVICKIHSHSLFYWGTVGPGTEAAVKNFPMVKEVSDRAKNQTHTSDLESSAPPSPSHRLSSDVQSVIFLLMKGYYIGKVEKKLQVFLNLIVAIGRGCNSFRVLTAVNHLPERG